ncbi:MAG TPA: hypothetical protein H9662_05350 [Firmicutes bacterium]|nr:hypothetical protein [Bacillota bacterium]
MVQIWNKYQKKALVFLFFCGLIFLVSLLCTGVSAADITPIKGSIDELSNNIRTIALWLVVPVLIIGGLCTFFGERAKRWGQGLIGTALLGLLVVLFAPQIAEWFISIAKAGGASV